MASVDDVISLLQSKGNTECRDGQSSQLEHALQSAYLAQQENAPPSMVVAALLHDVGHVLQNGSQDPHEKIGHSWVAEHFPPEVSEPVRLHVDAKRYLCATDPKYIERLAPTSVESLHKQGGPMTDTELDAFEEEAYYSHAVKLRHWDDRAKAEKPAVAGLEAYREAIGSVLKK